MTAMITREMVIEKVSEMFKHPVEFPIYKNGSLELTKYSVGRIDVYRKTRILPMQDEEQCYFCNILDIETRLPHKPCEDIFRYVELMYDKRKDGYREKDIQEMLQYLTI